MRLTVIAVLILGQSGCVGRARFARVDRVASPSADALIADYYRAIGGYDKLKGIQARHMIGTYVEGSLRASTDIWWERPGRRRVNVHAPGFEYSEGYDGETWEYNHLTKKLTIDTGSAADVGRRGAEFDESFVDYRAKGHRVELLGPELLRGSDVVHLRVTLADGFAKDYYFDARTHLIRAVGKAMPIHNVGASIETLSFYDEWRKEGGVLQPHAFVEQQVATGRVQNTLHWDRIETTRDGEGGSGKREGVSRPDGHDDPHHD